MLVSVLAALVISTEALLEPGSIVPVMEEKPIIQEAKKVMTNPTHYGDPSTGCENDEQAVRVQGIDGAFCSPPCTNAACPTDEPEGVKARPQCALKSPDGSKYCALVCQPSTLQRNGADGECGTGACQAISGVGICTYGGASAIAAVATESKEASLPAPLPSSSKELELMTATIEARLTTNPTHYGDPAQGCESDEQAVQVQDVSGAFCSPACKDGQCPSDKPDGATAHPMCALQTPEGDKFCALVCRPSALRSNGFEGECGQGSCQKVQAGLGLCTYSGMSNTVAAVLLESAAEMPLLM